MDTGAVGGGSSGRVVLTRVPGGGGRLRRYVVLVDEVEVGRVTRGGILRVDVRAGRHEVRLTTARKASWPLDVVVEPAGTVHLICGPGAPPAGGIALLRAREQPLGDGIRTIGALAFAVGASLLVASWVWEVHGGWNSRVADVLAETGGIALAVCFLARVFVRREVRRAAEDAGSGA